jgi:hypothetical protein
MTFEEAVGNINADYFFREFTFSTNKFKPTPREELQLADAVVWLDDLLIVAQVKERNAAADTTPEKEKNWFLDEIGKKAVRQIRDTLTYLKTYDEIEVLNNRGHPFNLASARAGRIHKLVIYNPNELLAPEYAFKKYRRSKKAGFVHLVHSQAYWGILNTLVTPVEIDEYLAFREGLADRWEDAMSAVNEKAVVGQYLRNLPEEKPNPEFAKYVDALDQNQQEWDIAPIINLFLDRKTTNNPLPIDYDVIKELAKLHRSEMRMFKERFAFSMKKAVSDEFCIPHRFGTSGERGFVFIPLRREDEPRRRDMLLNITALNKYDQRLEKCVGLSFLAEGNESWCDVQWHLMSFPWKEDPRIETFLQEHYPFRPVRERRVERYGLLPADEEG